MQRRVAGAVSFLLLVIVGLGVPVVAASSGGRPLAASPQVTQVSIVNGAGTDQSLVAFSPDTIKVIIGVNNTVMWTDNDNTMDVNGYLPDHVLMASNGAFTSPTLNPGDTYSFTFTTPGTYNYACTVHPWMTGSIVVIGTGGTSTSSSSTSTSTRTSGTIPAAEFPLPYVVLLAALAACAVAFSLAREGLAASFRSVSH